jgi:pyruvate-formate lyase-activating enzyme
MLNLLSKNAFRKFLRDPANATRKGLEKIATHFAANALDGWSPFPTNITFFLTYRCNLRCNVCGQWGVSGYVKGFSGKELRDEVDIDTLKRRIDEIASEKTAITLCGGEVLLYKQWFEFMSHVKSKGLECVLTTNGSMLEANARKLVEIGLDKLSLSLDGPEAVHNAARGAPDIFGKAMRGLQAVNRWKKELGSTTPVLEIGCTISDQNYKHLDEVVAIAETLDVSCLIFLHLAFLRDEEFSSQSRLFRELFDVESVHWSGYRYMPGAMDLEYLADKVAELKNRDGKFLSSGRNHTPTNASLRGQASTYCRMATSARAPASWRATSGRRASRAFGTTKNSRTSERSSGKKSCSPRASGAVSFTNISSRKPEIRDRKLESKKR